MANNVYYLMGKRDALAMRLATWGDNWDRAACDAYEAGYNS
jgi:hypothetical protein